MIVKELVDNALDACEENGVAPEIVVRADASGIMVADNGPGIPESTVEGILDFTVRVSSREAYTSPTRGAQGNALKTLAGIPYVLDPQNGRLVITSGFSRSIACRLNPISQRAEFGPFENQGFRRCSGREFLQIGRSPGVGGNC